MKTLSQFIHLSLLWAVAAIASTVTQDAIAQNGNLAEPLEILRNATFGPEDQLTQQRAWKQMSAAKIEHLPTILAAMKDTSPLAANWLCMAADAVAEREFNASGTLPQKMLESFATNLAHSPRGRRIAFQWLERVDPSAKERLLPAMLEDSSLELRYEAVAQLLDKAELETADDKQTQLYQKAFASARDVEQIESIAKKLTELGKPADLVQQMGYVVDWHLVGPFDNTDLAGFVTAFGPEGNNDTAATYRGKESKVSWSSHHSEDEYGIVDLNEAIRDEKEVVAYAKATVMSELNQPVQFRVASKNAIKLWVNGKQLAEHEVYHSGFAVDQYVVDAQLKAGANQVLLKVCQNAKKMGWEKEWEFRLRITDALGGAAKVAVLKVVIND